jgi:NTE family protein
MTNKNTKDKRIPKIGLALGSGSTRGYAHIGVIKVLEKNKIPIDFIAGSSVGAMIGSVYAFYKDSHKLEKIILSPSWRQIISFIDPSLRGGLVDGNKIKKFINDNIKKSTFNKLKIPFRVVATDFKTAEPIEISKGNVASAVQASISVPLFFKPVLLQEMMLWDGGLSESVPVETVRKMGADIVIAVNLDNKSRFSDEKDMGNNPYLIALKTLKYFQYHLAKNCVKSADIVINPLIKDPSLLGWRKVLKGEGETGILEGQKATKLVLPTIKKIIENETY